MKKPAAAMLRSRCCERVTSLRQRNARQELANFRAAPKVRPDGVPRERDGPACRPPDREGFGTRMLQRALASELGGTASLSFDPEGLSFAFEALAPTDGIILPVTKVPDLLDFRALARK
jgi:hypothetical protein